MKEYPINIGKRLALAVVMLGSTACGSAVASERTSEGQTTPERPACPTSIPEISYLAGGNPENWREVPNMKGAWVFRSESEQVLTGPLVGRLDGSSVGRIDRGLRVRLQDAWYVCPEARTSENPQRSS